MSIERLVTQAVNRMTEFYDKEDLHDYVRYCGANKLPYFKAMLFLDGQTRANYYITRIREPIDFYMRLAKQYNKEGGFER